MKLFDFGNLLSYLLFVTLFCFSEIFPYLVVIIGLENILVITKSVVTTPVHLEVKLRIAQGLCLLSSYLRY